MTMVKLIDSVVSDALTFAEMRDIARRPVLLLFLLLPLAAAVSPSGCRGSEREGHAGATIVFKHGVISGKSAVFRRVLDMFEQENPGISVRDETLPSSTDEQHQFYVINLEGGSTDFDVLSMDVIWVPEFAKAGWLRDLSHLLPQARRAAFFPGPIEAVTYRGGVWGVPWYIDAGVLFYRSDLLARYGIDVPRTWEGLASAARKVMSHDPAVYGFVWQGKEYEGLVCNILEYLWSAGGGVLADDRPATGSRENVEALRFARGLISRGVSPPFVTVADEETCRQVFASGRAVFMRNWPYAYRSFQGIPALAGRVGVAELPFFPGGKPAPALGGWQLGINRRSHAPEAAEKLVQFLTSERIQKELALLIGYQPALASLYRDGDFRRRAPFTAGLYKIFMDARPRPVTPYYMMMTQVLQSEFSAAIAGVRGPAAALEAADRQIGRILEMER